MQSPYPDLACAHHEAGHAVVALALGRRVNYVALTDGPGQRRGLCSLAGQFPFSTDGLHIVFAGSIAERRLHRDEPEKWHHCVEGSDKKLALRVASTIADDVETMASLLEDVYDATRRIVVFPRFWLAIAETAEQLVNRRRVEGGLVRAIAARCGVC